MATNSNTNLAGLKSDFRMLLIQNLEHLRNEILNTQWKFGAFDFGGESYQGKEAQQYLDKKYPRTALNILQNIESILSGEKDLVFGIVGIANEIDQSNKSKRYEIYQDYKTILNNMSSFLLEMIKEQIQDLIKEIQANKNFNQHVGKLENIYKKLNESIKSGASPITSLITLQNDISRGSLLQEEKFVKFFRKKIFPFITKLEELESIDKKIKVSEATQDLNIIINAMIKFNSDPMNSDLLCKLNSFNEMIVQVGMKNYNLTQILKHEPDFSKLIISNELLDQYFKYMQNDNPKILTPIFSNNVNLANIDWKNQSPDTFKNGIEAIHQFNHKENNFKECHAAHIVAMNIYTGPAYSVMNSLLRNKGVSPELFNGNISNDLAFVKESMRQVNSLKDPNHIQPVEMNKLVQETMLAVAVAAQGIDKSKHGVAEPHLPVKMVNDMLLPQQSRTIRGTGGDWAEQAKDRYRVAYEAGLPLYASEFASTSFSPNVAKQFTKEMPDKFITKHVPMDVMNQGGVGVDVSMISVFSNEAEYLYPPGCLLLPTPESDVKRKEHYAPDLDKKLAVVMTKGSSEKSFAYSSEVQAYRNSLIDMHEEIKSQKFSHPIKKQQEIILQKLEDNIKQLTTNLKTVNLYFLNEIPKDTKDPLFANSDASFVLSKSGKLSFVDPVNLRLTTIQLSQQDQNKLIDILKLKEEGGANQKNISYEKIHLLEKMIGQKLVLRHDSNAMITNMSDEIGKLKQDYAALKQENAKYYQGPTTSRLFQQLGVQQHVSPAPQPQKQATNSNQPVKEIEKSPTNFNQGAKEKEQSPTHSNQTEKEKDQSTKPGSDRFHF